jgi:hypothetical protein
LEQNVFPWLTKKAAKFVLSIDETRKLPDELIASHLDQEEEIHRKTVEAERKRKEQKRLLQEQMERERQEEKQRRRAARLAAKKAAELRKLKEEINESFIKKGEPREGMLLQDMVEIDGNYQRQAMIGCLGGMLGQLIVCFSALSKMEQLRDVDILDPKVVQPFIFLYIDAKMRTDKVYLQVHKAFEDFLNSLEKPLQLNEMRVMKEANYTKFRSIISDP